MQQIGTLANPDKLKFRTTSDKNANTTNSDSVNRLESLFERMEAKYGKLWEKQFSKESYNAVMQDWMSVLANVSDQRIDLGIAQMLATASNVSAKQRRVFPVDDHATRGHRLSVARAGILSSDE